MAVPWLQVVWYENLVVPAVARLSSRWAAPKQQPPAKEALEDEDDDATVSSVEEAV